VSAGDCFTAPAEELVTINTTTQSTFSTGVDLKAAGFDRQRCCHIWPVLLAATGTETLESLSANCARRGWLAVLGMFP
jgi:hypothetical protein